MRKQLSKRAQVVVIAFIATAGIALYPVHIYGHDGNSDPNLIHACIHKSTAQVRIVGANGSCNQSETSEHWAVVGPAGPRGLQGPAGAQGATGAQGPAGPAGPRGEAGQTGATGAQGPVGTQGPTGPAGPRGLTGEAGPRGESGPAGSTGAQGPIGEQGPAGPAGPRGLTGEVGPRGEVGPAGSTGAQGPIGEQGPAGPVGPRGLTGEVGPRGEVGPTGSTGAQGPIGEQGPAGPAGPRGLTGLTGAAGQDGIQGPAGPRGFAGTTGQDGITRRGTGGTQPTGDVNNRVQLPGLTTTVNVPDNAVVFVLSTGGVQSSQLSAGTVELGLYVDNVLQPGSRRRLSSSTSSAGPVYWNMSQIANLTAGNHTVTVEAFRVSGVNVDVSGPDGALLQGTLTVLVLNK